MQPKLVYCIIVTYNGMPWIEKCLKSLVNSTSPNYAIVIDNGSTDETVSFIKKRFPGVGIIETGSNLGFGQGNNIGLAMALENKADYIFLLNQDAWVEKDSIATLINTALDYSGYGILSPVHLNGKGDDFDPYFYDYLVRSDIRNCLQASFFDNDAAPVINTPFVNAAAWLITRECLEKTGGFDPIFFHYGEDNNFAHRVLFKGFTIGIVKDAFICHDKDYGTGALKNIRQQFKHDWIIFLHQACDIRQQGYVKMMIKRCCRYSLMTLLGLVKLNRAAIYYNFSMAKNIPLSFSAVRRSRKTNMYAKTPYLPLNAPE
jgi:GT2 family glycosyltransferase